MVLIGAAPTLRGGPASHTWQNLASCSARGLVHSWQRRLRAVCCCLHPRAAECAYGSLAVVVGPKLSMVVVVVVVVKVGTCRNILSLLSKGVRVRQTAVFWEWIEVSRRL